MTAGSPQKSTDGETGGTLSEAIASRARRNDREYQEFLTRTEGLFFVRDSLASVESQMADDLATPYSRVGAWCRRNAWGRLRLWCMNEDGSAARQKDCAAALKLHKGTVSKAFALLEARGVIEIRDNRIFPVLAPDLKPVSDPDKEEAYSAFIENWWKANNPDLARQLEEADALEDEWNAVRKRIRAIRRDVATVQKRDYEIFTRTGEAPAQSPLPGSLAVSGHQPVAGQQPKTELPTPQPPVADPPPEELPTSKALTLLVLDVKDGRDDKDRNGQPPAVLPAGGFAELGAAYDRHLKHHRDEPRDIVLETVTALAASAVFDWDRFRKVHPVWCAYHNRKGWQYSNLSFLAWIRAGMPPPPPEPVTKEQERGMAQVFLSKWAAQES